jgi:hypothetical protein
MFFKTQNIKEKKHIVAVLEIIIIYIPNLIIITIHLDIRFIIITIYIRI